MPGQVSHGEWTQIRKDGTRIPVAVSSRILPDGRWQAFVRDISAQKRMEDELRASEAKFRTLAEAVPHIVWITKPDGRNVYFNRQWVDYTGLTLEQSYGHGWNIPFHPDDRQRAWDAWQEAVRTDGVYSIECRMRRADGVYRWWLIRGASLHDASGKVINWFGTCTDVDDIKHTEDALRQSEERFRKTLEEAPIGIALVALDGRFVRVNRALSELVGYTPAELTQLTFHDITHPDDLDLDVKLAARLARGEIPRYTLDKRYLRKDGTAVDIELNASVLRDRDGAPLYYIAQIEDVTERKQAEAALRESERRLTLALDSAQMGIWDSDLMTNTTLRSKRHDEIFGYSSPIPDWSMGFLLDHVVPEDRDMVRRSFEEAFRSDVFELECRLRWQDGSIHWISSQGRVFRDPRGVPLRMLGTIVDISARKSAEEARRLSEARFSGIVSISADAIISIDDEQRITIFNDGAEKTFGYSKAEAIGAPLEMLIPERFRARHRQHVALFGKGSVSARGMGNRLTTIAGLRKDGEEFPAEAAISRLEVGDKTLLTVALRDITVRKRLEKELHFLAEATAALAATLDYDQTLATVARLVVRDLADWCIVHITEQEEHLSRRKVASADPAMASLCAQLEELSVDQDRPHLLRAVIETKQPLLIEHVSAEQLESASQGPAHLAALRAVNPTSLMAVPLLRHGELLGMLAFISSSVSRTYRSADLPLALALADRAAVSIENARLYRAAVHATQLRDQVLGIVAHDLRNPLNAVLMQASVLQGKPSAIIHRAATRMNRLIQDLLDVARMEAGQLRVERARVDSHALIVEAADSQRPLAASSSLDVQLDVAPDLPEVYGDRDRLLQVFENLIGNAMKFTPSGGRVAIGARSREDDVLFWVADTGCGMAAENLPRIFDRFWQATRPGRLGAGLGLPITKGIVEAHGGRIWVESTLDRGTTFFFAIPRGEPAATRPSELLH